MIWTPASAGVTIQLSDINKEPKIKKCVFCLPSVIPAQAGIQLQKNHFFEMIRTTTSMKNSGLQYETKSAAQTKKIAKLFAEELLETKSGKGAFVILFKGDLGAGKTTFIQGLVRALGIRRKITSPTFTLLRSYSIPSTGLSFPRRRESSPPFSKIHHFDCYRMSGEQEIKELGFKEMIKDPKNIILIEWPERIKKVIPKEKIIISLDYGDKLTERIIEIK
jgi:tRNA threonylcarbamoyladenosine biosynthesis protein TsaE